MITRHHTSISRRPAGRLGRPGAACVAALLAAGLLAACGSASGAGSITLYSGQHEQTTQSLVNAFEQQTGIHVNVRYNDEDSFADEIVTEAVAPGRGRVLYGELTRP